jgi:amidase
MVQPVIDEFALLDAHAQAALVRRGEVTPTELVDSAIARIEDLDDALNAVIHRRFDEARAEAASPSLPDGSFRGVPLVVKDLGAGGKLDGMPLHRGNRALRDAGYVHRAGDSSVIRRFRDAGFVILGKTNTPELGFSCTTESDAYGAARNPWDLARTPAGSSGGSAAAVAAGLVPVAHATDGGGSIRMPASVCGLVGLKPSRGRISTAPHTGESGAGRAVEGCVTRTVRDTAAILDVLAGAEPGDPVIAPPPARPFVDEVGAEPGSLRVGLCTVAVDGMTTHPDCVAAVEHTARVLDGLGHVVDEARPEAFGEPQVGIDGIIPAHAASTAAAVDEVGRMLGRTVTADDFEPPTWEQATLGRAYDAPQLVAAMEAVVAWTRRMAGWWRDRELLLMPTVGTPPPLLGHLAWSHDDATVRMLEFNPFCPAWNWTGQPAITLPLGASTDGLPVGVMLVAAYGREDLLLRVAAQLEEAAPWAERRPYLVSSVQQLTPGAP